MIEMKRDVKAVLEENPRIVTGTVTKNFTTYTSWRLSEIATLARCVLDHHEQVGSCIEQSDPAGAAAHAIQLDRAYQAMMSHSTKPVVAYGAQHGGVLHRGQLGRSRGRGAGVRKLSLGDHRMHLRL